MAQWDDSENQDPNNGAGPSPAGDPWTPQELAESQQWANEYYTTHQIPQGYGTPDDLANTYLSLRKQGVSHQDAMARTPAMLGWDKYGAAPTPSDPGTGAPPNTTQPVGTIGSSGLVPPDGTYPGGPPPQYGGGPALNLPDYKNFIPPEYQFEKFAPTTAADLLTDPGYQVRFDRGLDAVRADKAANGVLNGGGTARALLDYGQDSASQEFKNVDDRRLTDFNVNEGNRFKSYLSNVNTQFDTPYANAYKSALDTGTFAQNNSQFLNNSNYNNWLSSYNAWRNSRSDAFDQKFKIASN